MSVKFNYFFINQLGAQKNRLRATLKIFLFPLTRPYFTGMGRSVGNLFF